MQFYLRSTIIRDEVEHDTRAVANIRCQTGDISHTFGRRRSTRFAAFKLRRAAKRGLFPTYSILNGRKLVRLSEIVAAIERARTGEPS